MVHYGTLLCKFRISGSNTHHFAPTSLPSAQHCSISGISCVHGRELMAILTIIPTFNPCSAHQQPPTCTNPVCKTPTMHSPSHTPLLTTHRRALLAGVALGATINASPTPAAASADNLVQRGMRRFRAGDVGGSLADFDAAYEASPSLRPYLWQRGLSLYYAGTTHPLHLHLTLPLSCLSRPLRARRGAVSHGRGGQPQRH